MYSVQPGQGTNQNWDSAIMINVHMMIYQYDYVIIWWYADIFRCTAWAGSWPKLKLWKESLESVRWAITFLQRQLGPFFLLNIWIAIGKNVNYFETKVTFRGSSLQDRRLGVGDFGGRVGSSLSHLLKMLKKWRRIFLKKKKKKELESLEEG